MTWNILHDTPCEEAIEHPWEERREMARLAVDAVAPDILCLQEATPGQTSDLVENLPDHWIVGRDRQGGFDGEGCPVAFDTRRFSLEAHGQFWLGVTPDDPSTLTWGNDVPRIVTWARLEDRATGARFRIANVHLDHLVPTSRTKTARLLHERLGDATPGEPTILAGDFNSPAWAKPHRILTGEEPRFTDALRLAEERDPWYAGTFHHFKEHAFIRVDWVLVRPAVRTLAYRVIRETPAETFPSDHFPVVAEFAVPFVRV